MEERELVDLLSMLSISAEDLKWYFDRIAQHDGPDIICCEECDKRLTRIEDALQLVAGETFTYRGTTYNRCDCPKCRKKGISFHH